MSATAHLAFGWIRASALALLATFILAADLQGGCMATRPPRSYLWIEIVSCSENVVNEIAGVYFLGALTPRDDGADYSGIAMQEARARFLREPGVLIVARQLAFADSTEPFYTFGPPGGELERQESERPGVWRRTDGERERRYFLGSAEPTCDTLEAGKRVVVQEQSYCCDTGRAGDMGCILQAGQLVPSLKAPPTAEELAADNP